MTIIGLVLFSVGACSLVVYRSYVLSMLLSVEYMALSLMWLLINFMSFMFYEYYIMLYFFVFVVCEGALGLSLIVILIRGYGSDLILNMNLIKC